jgi:hypothetical protein
MRKLVFFAALCVACGAPQKPPPPPPEEPPATAPTEAPAPWTAPPLALADVPQAYLSAWQHAANRSYCPLLIMTDLGAGAGATARVSEFVGGWAVAYDKPGSQGTSQQGDRCDTCGREAFGVAGTSTRKGTFPAWDKEIVWADGGRARYERSGMTGGYVDYFVAHIEEPGSDCVYSVWSALGEQHLLQLLKGLRRVQM